MCDFGNMLAIEFAPIHFSNEPRVNGAPDYVALLTLLLAVQLSHEPNESRCDHGRFVVNNRPGQEFLRDFRSNARRDEMKN